jgi:hypothetical protein
VLNAFETWRKEMQLDSFNLCAHSMGVHARLLEFQYLWMQRERLIELFLFYPKGHFRVLVRDPAPTASQRTWRFIGASHALSLIPIMHFPHSI